MGTCQPISLISWVRGLHGVAEYLFTSCANTVVSQPQCFSSGQCQGGSLPAAVHCAISHGWLFSQEEKGTEAPIAKRATCVAGKRQTRGLLIEALLIAPVLLLSLHITASTRSTEH
ncbi:unnamed protein product [Pleuronectes platessa]|uniref:Uncharacterized protein n=1 Tax=Pleuronectes platessa TaxID=8262 RepID=A0A9N7VMF2_PLEPL|nr:unnamed protein product [Pleuronectes platessa]